MEVHSDCPKRKVANVSVLDETNFVSSSIFPVFGADDTDPDAGDLSILLSIQQEVWMDTWRQQDVGLVAMD